MNIRLTCGHCGHFWTVQLPAPLQWFLRRIRECPECCATEDILVTQDKE